MYDFLFQLQNKLIFLTSGVNNIGFLVPGTKQFKMFYSRYEQFKITDLSFFPDTKRLKVSCSRYKQYKIIPSKKYKLPDRKIRINLRFLAPGINAIRFFALGTNQF